MVASLSGGSNRLVKGNKTTSTVEYISDAVAAAIFPAIEQTARSQTQANYVGTYKSNVMDLASKITLSIRSGQPRLVVDSWYSNGTNFLGGLCLVEGRAVDVRMYPTGLTQKTSKTADRVGLRATFWLVDFAPDGGVFSKEYSTWEVVDSLMYGEIGVDEFECGTENGKAVSFTSRALRAPLQKAS